MEFSRKNYSDKTLLALYKAMLRPRLIEEKMLNLLRQGRVSKWFSGIGQEAIAAGATLALEPDEYIMPLHRNLGVFTSRGMKLTQLFAQLQGKREGFSKARERSFHFGSNPHHIVGMISHLGPQLSVGAGVALAHLLKKEPKVSLAFTGEGGTSEGEFHEALNVAAVWKLPVIFLIENNGYGLSTPTNEQYASRQLADRGRGYGMEAITIDGNNILEVFHTIRSIAFSLHKNPRPFLVECMTFRMRGHEEASGVKYVPKHLFEEWEKKDPLNNFEHWLLTQKVLKTAARDALRDEIKNEIEEAVSVAFALPEVTANTEEEIRDVYFPHTKKITPPSSSKKEMRFVDALAEGMQLAMEKHPNLILMGQDIAGYGGVFKVTDGLTAKFGTDRVRNTPLCESAILGIALGLSVKGMKSMVEMQFADFVTCGFNQIINNLAKIHYRWGQNAEVVVRMPTGAGVGAGPFHSQSNEAWFAHTPGLKVVYPSSPQDAKGLLLAAFEEKNPVMFFEHKALYRSVSGLVSEGYFTEEIGKAKIVREGDDVSIITYGAGVHWAMKAADELSDHSIEIVDLRTLLPLDTNTVFSSVKKTGKALVLHEDTLTGGFGGEVAALIAEHCFENLDAPVMRVASLDTAVPFAVELEKNFLPEERFREKLVELLGW